MPSSGHCLYRSTLTYANGVVESYGYNKANWITNLVNSKDGETLSSYAYTYYTSGSQKSETDHTGIVTGYIYDDLGRLTQESKTGGLTVDYTYDTNGNRARMAVSGTETYTVDYTYDANNRLTAENKVQNGVSTYTARTYDNNGNLLSELDVSGAAVVSHTYDEFNRLISTVAGTATITYTYNAHGIRTARSTSGGHLTEYLLDGSNVVGEVVDETTVTSYLRGVNLISDGTSYYLFNAHGDVVQLADSTGAVVKNYDYDAFGNEKNPAEEDANPFRYCGEYYDTETGLYYLRARYYDPALGRFTQEDTHWNTANMIYGDNPQKINEREDALGLKTYSYVPQISAIMQSGNLYVYGLSNPVLYADYNGEIAFLVITAIVGAVLGGIIGAVSSYVNTGEVSWESVGIGILAGGLVGLGCGAAAGVMLAGSATASVLAVSTGFTTLSTAISSGGLAAGATFLAENLQNATVQYTVLGHSPGYLELAKKIKARVFTIPTDVWRTLTSTQQWALNQEFLDVSISKGHEFIFSTNVYEARVGSYLYSEIQYLLANGYRIVDEGWRMIR